GRDSPITSRAPKSLRRTRACGEPPWPRAGALRLLDDFLVDGLDVRPHAVAVATERVLGEAGLVFRRQLVPDLRLHLVERRAIGRRLLHGRDEIDEVAAEERKLTLRPHLAVPGDDVVEAELLELGQGFGPLGRVPVVHE